MTIQKAQDVAVLPYQPRASLDRANSSESLRSSSSTDSFSFNEPVVRLVSEIQIKALKLPKVTVYALFRAADADVRVHLSPIKEERHD